MWNQTNTVWNGIAVIALFSVSLPVLSSNLASGNDCIITPSQTVDLGSPVPGQIASVLVDRSDAVTAGQIVATLDSGLEEANLAIADFRAVTDTELRLREAAHAFDIRTEKRLNSLENSKLISAQESERATRDARLSAWQTRKAKDELKLSRLELQRAEVSLERRKIRSPIDGVVLARMHNPGEYIEDQPLLRIVRLDPLHVEAILPMHLFGKIKPGMRASVVSEISTGSAYQATVDTVDPMGDAASGTFGVRLTLPNPDRSIPAGLKCRVEIAQDTPALTRNGSASRSTPSPVTVADGQQKSSR